MTDLDEMLFWVVPEIQSYEAHITIEPVFGDRFELFEQCCAPYKFKPAELLLQKQRDTTPIRSSKDSFCTGHSKHYDDLLSRTQSLVNDLKKCGFDVWRHKIEGIVLDVKHPMLINIQHGSQANKPITAGVGK